ncbi:hypothetical protein CFC21_074819 [Triticum aestivum]|uniref:F-box domain-containing protein n=2 Tax=Triticum aestivum TaxID=4565 RepID=A0A3B6LW84_WHEAT|nr:uncharacterized protein LOC123117655 [Triticum aestivum]KAF7069154.1 hypothetical protein CFC21_074819 [Triticum aestivum]
MEARTSSPAADVGSLPPDDLLREIFMRLPPEPIYLFSASFVCKHWRSLVHEARFLRRFRDFHGGTPPVLGFFNQKGPPFFVPTSGGFTLSMATMSRDDWWALDCRHGRTLIESCRTRTLLVWDLVTGDKQHLPLPEQSCSHYNGAVLCAAGHTDHHDCHSCLFLVVSVFSDDNDFITSACVFSSETGVWGEITSIVIPDALVLPKPMALVGNKIYSLLDNNSIIEFVLDKHTLGLVEEVPCTYDQILIMPTEDGCLGLAGVERFNFNLNLWSKVASTDGVVTWTHLRVIELEKILAPEAVSVCMAGGIGAHAVGCAVDADVIFIDVYPSIYMIHLKAMKIEEVSKERIGRQYVFPYTSFYAPGIAIGGTNDQVALLNNS